MSSTLEKEKFLHTLTYYLISLQSIDFHYFAVCRFTVSSLIVCIFVDLLNKFPWAPLFLHFGRRSSKRKFIFLVVFGCIRRRITRQNKNKKRLLWKEEQVAVVLCNTSASEMKQRQNPNCIWHVLSSF